MSRPRNPFGSSHPGRLPATMVKVLAAEMSDPSRLRRGKQYAKDRSVLDIVIEPGVVVCEVQGSRPTPYLATIEVSPGDGMPLRRDITCHCTCPDDDNWDNHACKHVVAALFTLSNEFLLEPELLDVWRARDTDAADDEDGDEDDDEDDDGTPAGRARPQVRRRHLSLVRTGDDADAGDADDASSPPSRHEDPLRAVLRVPPGASLPDIPLLEPAELLAPKRPELAATLRDALGHVRVEWD